MIDFTKVKIFCIVKLLTYIANPGETRIKANKVEDRLLHRLDNALNQKYFLLYIILLNIKSINKIINDGILFVSRL